MIRGLDELKVRYLCGIGVIRPGLLNCFLTCLAGAAANLAYENWSQEALSTVVRRVSVGYLGATCVVVFVLPWMQKSSGTGPKDLCLSAGDSPVMKKNYEGAKNEN